MATCPKLECRHIKSDDRTIEQLFCKATFRIMQPESPKVKLVCRSQDVDEYKKCFAYTHSSRPSVG